MYQQWDSRSGHSDFDFSPFSIAGIVKMTLERPCNPNFPLLASLFAIKTNMRVKNNLFWHVYGNTSCSKIVDDVTQAIFVTIFIGHDWQLSCILGLSLTSLRLLLKSNVLVTDSSRFPNIKNIYFEVNSVNLWWLEAKLKKYIFVTCPHFSQPKLWKWH